jgi:hypothetical protein
VGPTGAFYITYKLNNKISTIQTGIIYYYIWAIFFSFLFLLSLTEVFSI